MKGFTLLEVLVVTVILAMIAIMAQSSLFEATEATERAGNLSEFHVALSRGLFILTKDLTNLTSDHQGQSSEAFRDYPSGFGDSSLDAILFSSTLTKDPGGQAPFSDRARIGYFVMEDPYLRVPTLFRWVKNPDDGTIEDGGTLEPLIPNVKSLDFWYFDGKEWKDSWNQTPQKAPGIQAESMGVPLALALELRIQDPMTHEILSYRHIIEIPAGMQEASESEGGSKGSRGGPLGNQPKIRGGS